MDGWLQRMRPGHPWVARLFLLLLLGFAFGGWWWLMQRTLVNDREAVVGRLEAERQERFDRALITVGKGYERDRDDILVRLRERVTAKAVTSLIEDGRVDAVNYPEDDYQILEGVVPDEGTVGGLKWGSDGDGRDPVVSVLLDRVDEPAVREPLRERMLGRAGPPMKASFRHRAIERFLMATGGEDLLLEKVARAEALRAEGSVPADGLTMKSGNLGLWWSKEDVVVRFAAAGVDVVPGEEGRRFVAWQSPLRVVLAPVDLGEGSFSESAALVRWIGVGSGLLFAVVVLGALWTGWHDRKLARMRTDLAAAVAHELRTPLSGQRILLESLLSGLRQTPEEREDYLGRALRSNRRLSSLAEQFLTFSRLERGVLRVDREQVPVRELVDEVLASREGAFKHQEVDVPGDLVARVDRDALASIIGNLVENAWKYSDAEKWLRVTAGRDGDEFWLEVADRGQGLTASERRRMFRQFWRADTGLNRKVDGLGLGLAIVAKFAKAHGGRIEVESEPGKGSAFRVVLKEEET